MKGLLLTYQEQGLTSNHLTFAFGLSWFGGDGLLQFETFALSLANSFFKLHLIFVSRINQGDFSHSLTQIEIVQFVKYKSSKSDLFSMNKDIEQLLLEDKKYVQYIIQMTSPRKSIQSEKDSTLFGNLSQIEIMTTRISQSLIYDEESIKKMQAQLTGIEKQSTSASQDSKKRIFAEINAFEQHIKSYIVAQKAEYSRVAVQINELISINKDLKGQLQLLSQRFESFQRDVGL